MNHEQSTHTDNYREEEETDDNPEFVIQQDHSQQQFIYCFCKPCITDERNRQIWWHDQTEAPHQRNSCLRKEHYKRFWTMLLHWGVWNDDRNLLMKADAMTRNYTTQRFDWHKRDIMPKCDFQILVVFLIWDTSWNDFICSKEGFYIYFHQIHQITTNFGGKWLWTRWYYSDYNFTFNSYVQYIWNMRYKKYAWNTCIKWIQEFVLRIKWDENRKVRDSLVTFAWLLECMATSWINKNKCLYTPSYQSKAISNWIYHNFITWLGIIENIMSYSLLLILL